MSGREAWFAGTRAHLLLQRQTNRSMCREGGRNSAPTKLASQGGGIQIGARTSEFGVAGRGCNSVPDGGGIQRRPIYILSKPTDILLTLACAEFLPLPASEAGDFLPRVARGCAPASLWIARPLRSPHGLFAPVWQRGWVVRSSEAQIPKIRLARQGGNRRAKLPPSHVPPQAAAPELMQPSYRKHLHDPVAEVADNLDEPKSD